MIDKLSARFEIIFLLTWKSLIKYTGCSNQMSYEELLIGWNPNENLLNSSFILFWKSVGTIFILRWHNQPFILTIIFFHLNIYLFFLHCFQYVLFFIDYCHKKQLEIKELKKYSSKLMVNNNLSNNFFKKANKSNNEYLASQCRKWLKLPWNCVRSSDKVSEK